MESRKVVYKETGIIHIHIVTVCCNNSDSEIHPGWDISGWKDLADKTNYWKGENNPYQFACHSGTGQKSQGR